MYDGCGYPSCLGNADECTSTNIAHCFCNSQSWVLTGYKDGGWCPLSPWLESPWGGRDRINEHNVDVIEMRFGWVGFGSCGWSAAEPWYSRVARHSSNQKPALHFPLLPLQLTNSLFNQTLLEKIWLNHAWKFSIDPTTPAWKPFTDHSNLDLKFSTRPCLNNFNRDHDRVWKLFTDQSNLAWKMCEIMSVWLSCTHAENPGNFHVKPSLQEKNPSVSHPDTY